MADTPAGRRGSVQLTWLWMIVALAAVAAFLVWITAVSEPTPPVVLEEDTVSDTTDANVPEIELAELQANPTQHAGREYRIRRARVASQLSPQTFWIELPNGNPFLIRADSSAQASGPALQSGSSFGLIGTVTAMNDSTLTAWENAEVLTTSDQRLQAEFAEAFLEVRRVQAPRAGQQDSQEDQGGP